VVLGLRALKAVGELDRWRMAGLASAKLMVCAWWVMWSARRSRGRSDAAATALGLAVLAPVVCGWVAGAWWDEPVVESSECPGGFRTTPSWGAVGFAIAVTGFAAGVVAASDGTALFLRRRPRVCAAVFGVGLAVTPWFGFLRLAERLDAPTVEDALASAPVVAATGLMPEGETPFEERHVHAGNVVVTISDWELEISLAVRGSYEVTLQLQHCAFRNVAHARVRWLRSARAWLVENDDGVRCALEDSGRHGRRIRRRDLGSRLRPAPAILDATALLAIAWAVFGSLGTLRLHRQIVSGARLPVIAGAYRQPPTRALEGLDPTTIVLLSIGVGAALAAVTVAGATG
jgi:hypothetical protein